VNDTVIFYTMYYGYSHYNRNLEFITFSDLTRRNKNNLAV